MNPAEIFEKETADDVQDKDSDSRSRLDVETLTKEPLPSMMEQNTPKGWQELMGKDLLLKSLFLSLSTDSNDTNHESIHVQPQDAVLVDFTGYYCDDTTKAALFPSHNGSNAPLGTLDEPSSSAERLREYLHHQQVPIFHSAQDVWCVIGEKDVIPALEMGIRFMQWNETAVIFSHSKYAYGLAKRMFRYTSNVATPSANANADGTDHECSVAYTLPPEANVVFIVTLKQIASPDLVNQPSFQLKISQSKKRMANDIYQCDLLNENFQSNLYAKQRAIHVYQRAADMLESILVDGCLSEMESSEARSCRIDCLNNIVAVYLKCQLYHAAKEACVQVLKADPRNIKALLRAAKAALYDPASSYEEVRAAIQAVEDEMLQSPSSDATIVRDLEKVRRDFQSHQRKYRRQQREMYSRMAHKMVETKNDVDSMEEFDKPVLSDASTDDPLPFGTLSYARLRTTLSALPWRTILLPYGIQLVLFGGMLSYFYYSTRHEQDFGKSNSEL